MTSYPQTTLHALFAAQAARTPAAPALIDEHGEMSFRALDARANVLAHALVNRGLAPGSLVGICLERSRDSIAAALAVLKAGAAYVPLDPDYPAARIALIAADTRLRYVLTHTSLRAGLPPALDAICVDRTPADEAAESIRAPDIRVDCDDWCFVVYTSGSTGVPKGVGSSHRATIVMCDWFWRAHPFGEDERFCHRTTLNFIVSAWEIFAPLLRGVPVVLAPGGIGRDPTALVEFLNEARVTRLLLVPTLLRAVLATMQEHALSLPSLRYWICAGEPLPTALARHLLAMAPGAVLLNLYGCSETHSSTCYRARTPLPNLPSVPIGRPLDHRRVYLLDDHGQAVAAGEIGELHVAGDGVSSGYIDRPELSAERFVALPELGETLVYRTGDRARCLDDGNFELLGRSDRQVQIRGFRVELMEVEAALMEHPSVGACLTTMREDRGVPELAAYVVLRQAAGTISAGELRAFLRQSLPDAMIPASVTFLAALPTTPNGKLDPLSLPDPDRTRSLATACVPPRTPTEATLVEIWADALAVRPIGILDDFFELGGYSNKAATVLLRIRDELGILLPLETFFRLQNIERIASEIERLRWLAGFPADSSADMVRGDIE